MKEAFNLKKTYNLTNEVYVSSAPFIDGNSFSGERVLVCGTYYDTATKVNNIFVAAFNSVYNTTEGVYEAKSSFNETCKAIMWDKYEERVISISEVYANKIDKATCYDIGADPGTISWNIAVRSFSVQGLMLYWTKLIGNPFTDEFYGGSSQFGFTIYLAANTKYSNGNNTVTLKSLNTLSGGIVV